MYSGVIYLATNQLNGHKYVGQTTRFNDRLKEHKYSKDKTYFHNAIKKYGFDSFKWEILQIFSCSSKELLKRCLNNAEIRYIKLFNTFTNGYNMNIGGGSNIGMKHTEESKRKMSLKQSGKKVSDETRRKLRDYRLGTKQTEQQKEKVSKRIIMTDMDNNYICTWKSSMDAERNGGFDHSAIIKCCKNKQPYHKNFKFRYETINET